MLSFLVVTYSHIIICQKLTFNLFVCLLLKMLLKVWGYIFVYDLISASNFEKSMNFKVAVFLGDFPSCHCVWDVCVWARVSFEAWLHSRLGLNLQ